MAARRITRRSQGAFSLLELLVVIGIIAALLAIAIPVLSGARAQGRRVACANNLKQLGLATAAYHVDNNGRFWRVYEQKPDGRHWWFGFEPDGPGTGTGRPLDKSRSALAPYLDDVGDRLQCPDFPYDNDDYYPKFAERAASYGYNLNLGPIAKSMPVARLQRIGGRAAQVVVFADAVHFDFGQRVNEGHYLYPIPNANQPSGYAHFRHAGVAQYLTADGSVSDQSLNGPAYREAGHAPAGNLTASDGSLDIYNPER